MNTRAETLGEESGETKLQEAKVNGDTEEEYAEELTSCFHLIHSCAS